jgi:hypothetical protein
MGEPLTPHLRADQSGRDVVLLVRVGSAGAELLAGRDRMPGKSLYWGYCPTPYCPDKEVIQPDTSIHWPVWIEDFWISTAHEVTATQIDKPLRIESPGFAAGKPVAVEARLFEGLRIRDRAGMPAAINWRWYPGDTAATPNPFIGAQAPPGCQDKLVCQFTPTRAGRMRVFTTVEGAAVDESQVLGVTPDPTLTLECTPNPVVRGDDIKCDVSTPSGGALTDISWEFTGNGFRYPDIAAGDFPASGVTWGGQMVMSGTVSVRAKVHGVELSKEVVVTVEARPEFLRRRVPVVPRVGTLDDFSENDPPDNPPNDQTDLGRSRARAVDAGWNPSQDLTEAVRLVGFVEDEGPNHGLAYLKEVPLTIEATVLVHPELAIGTQFYRAQATRRIDAGIQPCLQSDFNRYIRLVKDHEGFDVKPVSHLGFYESALNPAAAQAVEHIVGSAANVAAMARAWAAALDPVTRAARRRMGELHDAAGGKVNFGCEFNWDRHRRR